MIEEERKFKKINWDVINTKPSVDVTFETNSYANEVINKTPELRRAHELAVFWLQEAVNDVVAALQLKHPIRVKIIPYVGTQQAKVCFEASRDPNIPHQITIRTEFFTQILINLAELGSELKDISITKRLLRILPELSAAIAHELYHARQFEQNTDSYQETLLSNTQLKGYIKENKTKDISAISPDILNIYTLDKGERGARAFAIRYLLEKAKRSNIDNEDLTQAYYMQVSLEIDKLERFIQGKILFQFI